MTCIVGIADGQAVWIGGDSAGVSGLDLQIRRDAKVFINGEFVFGCTSSFRMIQLLRYSLNPPKRHPETDVFAFMATQFINAVRACLREGGFAGKQNEVESGGQFLVGYRGRLFCIHADYQVAERAEGYDACGCGEAYALGSMFSAKNQHESPRDQIQNALSCAANFSAGVAPPFIVIEGGKA